MNQTLQQIKDESKRLNGPLGTVPPALQVQPDSEAEDSTELQHQDQQSPSTLTANKPEAAQSARSAGKRKQAQRDATIDSTAPTGKRKQATKSTTNAQPSHQGNTRGLGKTHVASAAVYAVARRAAGLIAFAYEAVTGHKT